VLDPSDGNVIQPSVLIEPSKLVQPRELIQPRVLCYTRITTWAERPRAAPFIHKEPEPEVIAWPEHSLPRGARWHAL
jgi:hypothetical protein